MSLSSLVLYQRLTQRAKLRHMQALVALDDLRSMSRAAKAMGMTQPAMSQLVAEFEQLIETRLFLRHSRGVDPTPAALDLLPIARRMVFAAEEGADRIASHQRRDGGLVRVASTAAATGGLLCQVLPDFAGANPNIQVQVSTVIGQSLDASFADDEYDVVCCRLRDVVPEGWSFRPCIADDLIVMAGHAHPLAGKGRVSSEELGAATWLQNYGISVARQHFDDLIAREGWIDVKLVHVTSRVSLVTWSMLRDGRLLSLVPRSVVAPWLEDGLLVELPVDIDLQLGPVGYHWRPEQAGLAARKFAAALDAVSRIT